MSAKQSGNPLDIRFALAAIRRRIKLIVLCAVVAAAAAAGYSASHDKEYTATASLLFRAQGLDQTFFGATFLPPDSDPTRAAATNLKLVSLGTVASRTASALKNGMGPGDVSSRMQIAAQGNSNVVAVSATDKSPKLAATLANTFVEQFIAFRRDADRSKVIAAEQLVQHDLAALKPSQQNSPQAKQLRSRGEQLKVLESLQTGNAELVQRADVPGSPSSPLPKRDGILGGLIGLLLGIVLAFVLERLDRRLKSPNEVSELFDRPILGAIPESKEIAGTSQDFDQLSTAGAEPLRMLRANLRYFNVDREVRTVLVTSAGPGEGKSTVCKHLASAAASTGERVLLLEADLRRPTLKNRMNLAGDGGLSQVLAGTRTLRSAIQQVEVAGSVGERRTLSVLASGPIPPNPTDLIESDRMRQVLKAVGEKYDLVVIDTPPTSVVSDAIPLVKNVDGILVVSRLGKTTRDASMHLRDQLGNLGAHVLGVVVNSVTRASASGYAYGYGYGYGYGGDPYTSRKKDRKAAEPVAATSNGHSNGHAPDGGLDIEQQPERVGPDYPE